MSATDDKIARWRRLSDCDALAGAPLGDALKEACDEIGRLSQIAKTNGALHRSAEGDVSAVHALVERWQQGVTNLYAANEEESEPAARAVRYVKAEAIEVCVHELREALHAPHSPAEPVPPVSTPAETGEAQEARK